MRRLIAVLVAVLGAAMLGNCCLLNASPELRVQSPGQTSTSKQLDTPIELSEGELTVADFAADLAKWSGMAITASSAVGDRKVIVALGKTTPRLALDCLCDMYDWRWSQHETGTFVIERKAIRRPSDIRQIPSQMQASLPVDVRAFAGLPNLKTKLPDDRTSPRVMGKVGPEAFRARDTLKASLATKFESSDEVAVKSLNADQLSDLVGWLLFDRFVKSSLEILHDDYAPHRIDPAKLVVKFQNDGKDIMVTTGTGIQPGFGFGASMMGPDR